MDGQQPPRDIESSPLPATTLAVQPTDPSLQQAEQYRRLMYNTCFGLCIACPVIMLLPPRRVDFFTFGLGITWFTCAGYVTEQRTGQGILWHLGHTLPGARHRERVEELRKQEEESARLKKERAAAAPVRDALLGRGKEQDENVVKKVWMGNESDDWVEERKRKEREALEEGRGYGSLIWDQVKDVWGVKEEDEEAEEEFKAKVLEGIGRKDK